VAKKSGTPAWATMQKKTLNRLTLGAARRGLGPFSIVTTVGRKSGKTYETPIIVQPTDGGFMIELTYGDQVQWYRNALAAGGCTITYKRVAHPIVGFEPGACRDRHRGLLAVAAAHPAPAPPPPLHAVPHR
jgi:deazaflavin-dependent oxidoreductase (nitroreductase family)